LRRAEAKAAAPQSAVGGGRMRRGLIHCATARTAFNPSYRRL